MGGMRNHLSVGGGEMVGECITVTKAIGLDIARGLGAILDQATSYWGLQKTAIFDSNLTPIMNGV